MVSCKDKIVIFPLFNTCYPQNLARNLARFFQVVIAEQRLELLHQTRRKKYLYNRKERQQIKMTSESLNDFGARFYDSQIERFTTQDSFAEKYIHFTPCVL